MKKFQTQFLKRNILNNITPLFASILNNKYDTLKIILTRFKDTININYSTHTNFTPLHLLCSIKNTHKLKTIELFLNHKNLKVNELKKNYPYSALHCAILYNKDIAEELIKVPNLTVYIDENDDKNDFSQRTVFEDSIMSDFYSVSDFILSKTTENLFSKFTYSSIYKFDELNYFRRNGCVKIDYNYRGNNYPTNLIKYLTKDLNIEKIRQLKKQVVDKKKQLFLYLAARYSDEQSFECFLDKYEVDINEEIPDTVFKKKYFK